MSRSHNILVVLLIRHLWGCTSTKISNKYLSLICFYLFYLRFTFFVYIIWSMYILIYKQNFFSFITHLRILSKNLIIYYCMLVSNNINFGLKSFVFQNWMANTKKMRLIGILNSVSKTLKWCAVTQKTFFFMYKITKLTN